MKRTLAYLTLALAALLSALPASAQKTRRELNVMEYVVVGQDTVYLDEIPPAVIHPRQTMSKRDWVKYYKRVHNFSKAYPYALLISRVVKETDSLFIADNYSKREKEKYLSKLKDQLINDFDPLFRKLTLKQGLMMIRLVDRECGQTPYYIVKNYLGGISAGFWQGVARMFKGDLKQPYDRYGEDKDLEELVGYWDRGEFDYLYITIFGKPRPEIPIPDRYKDNPPVPKKQRSPRTRK
ncbi:MAG: DUF4294 domain-containing protein [Bacteroidales bacterium]|nr:DUF4294 domain-containing protein [Bacteroidales bacterium]